MVSHVDQFEQNDGTKTSRNTAGDYEPITVPLRHTHIYFFKLQSEENPRKRCFVANISYR